MSNEQKLENLKSLIRSSIMLSVQEKEEWLGLVELMNDKQMSELLELLGHKTSKPTSPPVSPESKAESFPHQESQVDHKVMPSLSHISNLPNSVTGYVEDVSKVSSPNLSAAQKILAPAYRTTPIASASVSPQASELAGKIKAQDDNPVNQQLSEIDNSPSQPSATLVGIDLSTPQEVATLTVDHLRKYGINKLAQKLKELASQYGYFTVLDNIEQSELYSAYIASGQRILTGQIAASDKELSAQEFGMIADLMSSLKINRF